MSLFDGQPLTEDEVAERDLCQCGHARVDHFKMLARSGNFRDANDNPERDDCCACECDGFTSGGDAEPKT